ncbi:MAG: type VI secretion system-associated FHA domain protein, partial [Methylococcales bacterium]
QLAMQAGIKASLAHLLKTFDPDSLEKRFTQGILLQKNAKCWERYKASYQDTANEALDNFFGDAFVTAYEKQMKILMTMRKSR